MFIRLIVILSILAIPIGIILIIAASVHDFGAIFVRPLCTGEFQVESLSCITETGITEYEDMLGGGGVITLVVASFLLPFSIVFRLMATSAKLDHIIENGESAEATILQMQSTGTTVNDQPLLNFRLEVRPAYGQSYEAETKRIIPHGLLGSLGLGMTIPVKYDPNKPEDVALDLETFQASFLDRAKRGQAFSGNSDNETLSEKLQELEEAYRLELISKEEYEASRQRILNEL